MSRSPRRIPAVTSSILAGVALLVVAAAPAVARTSVDPTTLNPPPPAIFAPVCSATGYGTTCTVTFSDPPVVDEPSGVVCGATELHVSFTRDVTGKRVYDADGDLVQRHFRESFAGTYVNPDTGKSARWDQHDTVIHDLAVPGDAGTGVSQISGRMSRVYLPGGGTILTDTGTFTVDESTGEQLSASGNHPFDDYFARGDASALAALCDALD